MVDRVGKLQGVHKHDVQLPPQKTPENLETLKATFGNIQSSQKAYTEYMESTDKKNPLKKRELKQLKKPPLGKQAPGPQSNLPLNRVG